MDPFYYMLLVKCTYDHLEGEGTNLAKFHPRVTIVLYYEVKWCVVTTAGPVCYMHLLSGQTLVLRYSSRFLRVLFLIYKG